MGRKSTLHGIELKKKYGQHFLNDSSVVHAMIEKVHLDATTSVFEIGPGGGFLTREILNQTIARLWCFEIDADWVAHLHETIKDDRLTVFHENFLDIPIDRFAEFAPWTVLANLPYQVTFPILHMFYAMRAMIKEGVIMVQEEVAQKITKTRGRGFGFPALFFQHYFSWEMLKKIPPGAFNPPPKVHSRLLYFRPRANVQSIVDEDGFWKFIKIIFKQPRRTLRNNLAQSHFDLSKVQESVLNLRAQQLSMSDFLALWKLLR